MSTRYRVTAIVVKDGKILLVRDKGRDDYSMPGGGIKLNEPTLIAGIREIYEETKLKVVLAERLRYCDFEGQRASHKVCLLKVEGNIRLNENELESFVWWDMKGQFPVQNHVKKI